jgi:hypothetical protein
MRSLEVVMPTQQISTWGHKEKVWEAAKAEARTILEEVARKKRRPMYYSELSSKITSITFQPDSHDLHGLLGQLSEDSEAEGKGMISALVVHKEDGRPGNGFFTLAKELGRDISDPEKCWLNELNRVYAAF